MSTYTYVFAYVHVCIDAYKYTSMHACIHAAINMRTRNHRYTHTDINMNYIIQHARAHWNSFSTCRDHMHSRRSTPNREHHIAVSRATLIHTNINVRRPSSWHCSLNFQAQCCSDQASPTQCGKRFVEDIGVWKVSGVATFTRVYLKENSPWNVPVCAWVAFYFVRNAAMMISVPVSACMHAHTHTERPIPTHAHTGIFHREAFWREGEKEWGDETDGDDYLVPPFSLSIPFLLKYTHVCMCWMRNSIVCACSRGCLRNYPHHRTSGKIKGNSRTHGNISGRTCSPSNKPVCACVHAGGDICLLFSKCQTLRGELKSSHTRTHLWPTSTSDDIFYGLILQVFNDNVI